MALHEPGGQALKGGTGGQRHGDAPTPMRQRNERVLVNGLRGGAVPAAIPGDGRLSGIRLPRVCREISGGGVGVGGRMRRGEDGVVGRVRRPVRPEREIAGGGRLQEAERPGGEPVRYNAGYNGYGGRNPPIAGQVRHGPRQRVQRVGRRAGAQQISVEQRDDGVVVGDDGGGGLRYGQVARPRGYEQAVVVCHIVVQRLAEGDGQ